MAGFSVVGVTSNHISNLYKKLRRKIFFGLPNSLLKFSYTLKCFLQILYKPQIHILSKKSVFFVSVITSSPNIR